MRVKTRGKAVKILTEWKESYERQFRELIKEMERATARGDLRTIGYCIGQLDGMQKKLLTLNPQLHPKNHAPACSNNAHRDVTRF